MIKTTPAITLKFSAPKTQKTPGSIPKISLFSSCSPAAIPPISTPYESISKSSPVKLKLSFKKPENLKHVSPKPLKTTISVTPDHSQPMDIDVPTMPKQEYQPKLKLKLSKPKPAMDVGSDIPCLVENPAVSPSTTPESQVVAPSQVIPIPNGMHVQEPNPSTIKISTTESQKEETVGKVVKTPGFKLKFKFNKAT
jgi:hypothetical protein